MSKRAVAHTLVRALRRRELTPFRFVMAFQRAGFTADDAWEVVAAITP